MWDARGAAEISSTTNMAAAKRVDDEGDTEDAQCTALAEDDGHPWSYLGTMFSYLGMGANSKTYRMKSMLCLPKCHEIKAFKNSPSNLKKHIEVSELSKQCHFMWQEGYKYV